MGPGGVAGGGKGASDSARLHSGGWRGPLAGEPSGILQKPCAEGQDVWPCLRVFARSVLLPEALSSPLRRPFVQTLPGTSHPLTPGTVRTRANHIEAMSSPDTDWAWLCVLSLSPARLGPHLLLAFPPACLINLSWKGRCVVRLPASLPSLSSPLFPPLLSPPLPQHCKVSIVRGDQEPSYYHAQFSLHCDSAQCFTSSPFHGWESET